MSVHEPDPGDELPEQNWRVTLRCGDDEAEVIVQSVYMESLVMLGGFDPSFCPPSMEDHIQFISKGLTATIWPDSPVEVVGIEATDEPVPDPEVNY